MQVISHSLPLSGLKFLLQCSLGQAISTGKAGTIPFLLLLDQSSSFLSTGDGSAQGRRARAKQREGAGMQGLGQGSQGL